MKLHLYYVYILCNARHNVLYTGVTNQLYRRVLEHKMKLKEGFTKNYNVNKLVYYEEYDIITDAILREKQIKGMRKQKKIDLIKKRNPLFAELFDGKKILPI